MLVLSSISFNCYQFDLHVADWCMCMKAVRQISKIQSTLNQREALYNYNYAGVFVERDHIVFPKVGSCYHKIEFNKRESGISRQVFFESNTVPLIDCTTYHKVLQLATAQYPGAYQCRPYLLSLAAAEILP